MYDGSTSTCEPQTDALEGQVRLGNEEICGQGVLKLVARKSEVQQVQSHL